MSKLQNVMLVSVDLTAATVCTARACTKRLDKTQWPETRDETYWAETETYCSEIKTLRILYETEMRRQYVSRPRRLDRDHIPGYYDDDDARQCMTTHDDEVQ